MTRRAAVMCAVTCKTVGIMLSPQRRCPDGNLELRTPGPNHDAIRLRSRVCRGVDKRCLYRYELQRFAGFRDVGVVVRASGWDGDDDVTTEAAPFFKRIDLMQIQIRWGIGAPAALDLAGNVVMVIDLGEPGSRGFEKQ